MAQSEYSISHKKGTLIKFDSPITVLEKYREQIRKQGATTEKIFEFHEAIFAIQKIESKH